MGAQSLYKVMSQSAAIFDIPPFWTQWTDSNFNVGNEGNGFCVSADQMPSGKNQPIQTKQIKFWLNFSPISIEAFYKVELDFIFVGSPAWDHVSIKG